MSTMAHTADIDLRVFDAIMPKAYPKSNAYFRKVMRHLLKDGVIHIETLFEKAVSRVGKLNRNSVHGEDFIDGTDAKKSTVRWMGYGNTYSAPIHRVHTKNGALRVMVYERLQDKFYYFVIPHHAFQHITDGSNIEIPFELDGTPRRVPKRKVIQNWWEYEVKSFKKMATMPTVKGVKRDKPISK